MHLVGTGRNEVDVGFHPYDARTDALGALDTDCAIATAATNAAGRSGRGLSAPA